MAKKLVRRRRDGKMIYAIVNEISNVVNYKKPGALDFTRTPGFS